MKFKEIIEQVGGVGTVPPVSSSSQPTLTGNVSSLADPKIAAAQLNLQKQQKEQTRRAIMQQIADLNKQLADLNKTA